MDARKWDAEAAQRAASAAKAFLEERGQSLTVPMLVEVFLIGFDTGGGYGHRQEANALLQLLSPISRHCPHSLTSGEELGVCFNVEYQVVGGDEVGAEAATLLKNIEGHMKANLVDTFKEQAWNRPRGRTGQGQPAEPGGPNRTIEYSLEASNLEPLFNDFLEKVYNGNHQPHESGGGHGWHSKNQVFVINPSKVRANPKGTPEDAAHTAPHFLQQWESHTYDPNALEREEAGMVYRYKYNGTGEATSWFSSRNYFVIDVAAGPTTYGPAVSSQGAVAPSSAPALRTVYQSILADLKSVGATLTAQQHAQMVAEHAQRALFEGALAATISSGVHALFVPDMMTEHIEYAKNILIPVVLLTDYELTDDDYSHRVGQENFMHINLTHVEHAVGRLVDEEQNAVVVSSFHPLSKHKGLAAALWKARRSKSEQALDQRGGKAARLGYHSITHTSVDPDVLLEELSLVADTLTHGITGAATTLDKEGAHPLEKLRHDGTRVVPVFVFSLMQAPDDIMFSNREMVAASHDAVMVLQLRHSAQWGGAKDDYFTGHMTNGKRVSRDARDVTRQVIAGLSQALSGVTPPYYRPRHPHHPPHYPTFFDWRWAVGATPFGPYGAYAGVSEMMQNAARRNILLSHIAAGLKAAQHRLEEFDEFVSMHFEGPWARVGMGEGAMESRKHFLDTVVNTRHGYRTALTPEIVAQLEGHMSALSRHLEDLAVDLYAHDFAAADKSIRESMLPAAARLCAGLDATIEEGQQMMACCGARHVSTLGRLVWMVVAAVLGFAVFFALAVLLVVLSGRRRRAAEVFALPTYGLSQYSRPASRRTSWQA